MGIFYSNDIFKEKEFDLRNAIKTDEVDLIFGESIELLEEIAHIKGKDRMQIIIRNFIEDNTDSHAFSMKFIPNRKILGDSYGGRKGIPIVFYKLTRREQNKIIEYPSDWKIYLGGSSIHIDRADKLMKALNKKECAFIDAVVKKFGILILEYWSLDPNDPIQYNRIREIQQIVENYVFNK